MTFSVRTIEALCYRYPLSTPVVTWFGRMLNRPGVFARAEDQDGVVGWGEVFSSPHAAGALIQARRASLILKESPLHYRRLWDRLMATLGYDRISVIEFGVAGGNGLVALESCARQAAELSGVAIDTYGFDTGTGLPKPTDVQLLADLSTDIVGSGLCDHERLATLPFASGMRYFRGELDADVPV